MACLGWLQNLQMSGSEAEMVMPPGDELIRDVTALCSVIAALKMLTLFPLIRWLIRWLSSHGIT